MMVKEGYKEVRLGVRTFEIPNEWDVSHLENFCEICYGKEQSKVENEEGDYPILGTGGIIGYADEYLFNKASVLIGRKGTIDEPQYIDQPFWTIDTLFYTDIDFQKTNPKWLYFFLDYYNLSLLNEATGVPSLSRKNLYNLSVPRPPLQEQKKIASILSSVDKAIEKTAEIIEEAKQLKRGLMKHLLIKGISHSKYKELRIGAKKYKIPYNWSLINLGNVFKLINGRAFKKSEWSQKGLQIIRIQDLRENENAETNYCDFEVDKKYYVEKGDLLFCWAGNINTSLGAYIWEKEKAVLNQHIYNMKAKKEISNSFYKYYINYMLPLLKNYTGGSAGQIHITKGDLKSFDLLVPPLEEQKEIASILSSVDNKIQKEQEYKEQLEQLKKGLMQKLLTGEIRVKVDEEE